MQGFKCYCFYHLCVIFFLQENLYTTHVTHMHILFYIVAYIYAKVNFKNSLHYVFNLNSKVDCLIAMVDIEICYTLLLVWSDILLIHEFILINYYLTIYRWSVSTRSAMIHTRIYCSVHCCISDDHYDIKTLLPHER